MIVINLQLVNLFSKVSDNCIRNLGFNFYLHQKLIGVLVR